MLLTWWRGGGRRTARAVGGGRRRVSAHFRPGLERLEDRRLLAAGALDPGFGAGGQVLADFGREVYPSSGLAVQPDGKIVVAATVQSDPFAGVIAGRSNLDILLARYNADGTLDPTFGDGGRVVSDFLGNE